MKIKIKDLAIMAMMLAILVVCSKISFNIGIISLTLQTFAVASIGLILKWKKALIVFFTYIVMGLIGIPVFSTGGGYQYIFYPSFGFIIGFMLSSFVTGSNLFNKNKWMLIPKALLGLIVIDIVGLIYMYLILNFYMDKPSSILYVLEVGFTPFIIKDSISVVLASLIAIRLEPAINNIGEFNNSIELNKNKE